MATEHPTRITVVGLNYAPEPTGIAPYTSGLCDDLAAKGHQVTVVTGVPHYPQWKVQGTQPRTQRRNGVTVSRVRHYVPERPFGLRRLRLELSFGIRSVLRSWRNPESLIFVSPALIATFIGTLKARLFGIPYRVWVQDIYSLGISQVSTSRMARAMAHLESRVLKKAQEVIVIHDRFRRYVCSELGVSTAQVRVIRNWSHLAVAASTDVSAVRTSYGWSDDDVVVLHAGNMGAKQGLDNVVAAARLAAESGSPLRFAFVGDGNMRQALECEAVGSTVQFIDPVPDAEFARLLSAADVLLVSEVAGLTEMSVPSKLTTYFASGVPVLASVSSSSVTADEMHAAGAGPRVDPGDSAALVDTAEWLSRTEKRDAYVRAAQNYARQVLSRRAAVEGFESILEHPRPARANIGIPVTR